MTEPKIKIILDQHWNKSHIYINGEEIPVTRLEIAPMDGDQPLVRVKIEVLLPYLEVIPTTAEFIEKRIKESADIEPSSIPCFVDCDINSNPKESHEQLEKEKKCNKYLGKYYHHNHL